MSIATIKVPAHWNKAALKDIERELVGLVIETAGLPETASVSITGVRRPGIYPWTWATVAHSRSLRRTGQTMEIRYTLPVRQQILRDQQTGAKRDAKALKQEQAWHARHTS